jgi:hypothetical protein
MSSPQQIIKHITTSTTTNVTTETCYLLGLYLAVNSPGTSWTLSLKDRDSTVHSLGVLLLNAPGNATDINGLIKELPFPARMANGIDIVTAGTAGNVDIWIYISPAT